MKKIIYITALAAVALTLAGCNAPGDKFPYGTEVIMMTGTGESPMTKLSIEDTPPASYAVSVSATGKVAEDVTVELDFCDADALAAYNQSHGSSYEVVPLSAFETQGTSVTIAANTSVSTSNTITLKDYSFIKSGSQYIIPVSIKSVSNGNMEVLESSRTLFIRISQTISFYALDINNPGLSSNFIFEADKKIDLPTYTYEIKVYPVDLKHEGAEQLCRLCNWTGAKEERQNMLRFNENGRPWKSLQIVTPSGGDYTTTTIFETGQWYMLSMVYDGSTYQLYINGEPDGTTLTSKEHTAFQRFEIGMSYQGYNSGQLFNARICEVRIWDYARSKGQISGSFCGVDPASEGLRAYWKFDEGSGHIFHDKTGNGYDMDWTKSQRAVSGDDLSPTPECGSVAEGRWVKDDINKCSQ